MKPVKDNKSPFLPFVSLILLLCMGVCEAVEPDDNLNIQHKQNLKIIALAPHIVELLFDIGAGHQIIATGTYADFPEQAKTLPRVGDHSRLQIEKILQLRPDLVIAWRSGNSLTDLARLEEFGIRVFYSDPKVLEDVSKEIRIFGELTGRQQQANLLADNYQLHLTNMRKQYAAKQSISVFYEIWPAPMQTIAGDAWPQQHLDLCGARNIFAEINEDYPSVSLEQVISRMPQVIIQPKAAQQIESRLFDWQQFGFIPAVENHFILRPNADKVYRMTTRVLSEIELLCENIERARLFYAK